MARRSPSQVCSRLQGEHSRFPLSAKAVDNDACSRNVIVIGLMEVISEVQVFAEKVGLGTETMEKMIGNMFGPVAESYSKRCVSSPLNSCCNTIMLISISPKINDRCICTTSRHSTGICSFSRYKRRQTRNLHRKRS